MALKVIQPTLAVLHFMNRSHARIHRHACIWSWKREQRKSFSHQCHMCPVTSNMKVSDSSQYFSIADVQSQYVLKPLIQQRRNSSSNQNQEEEKVKVKTKTGQAGQLAKVFAEYGSIGVVFHTCISLTSLGICYVAVSSGIDVPALLQKLNLFTESGAGATLATGASTFVIAYACHKVFMPLRIFCTVTCTPLIVKRLRNMGILKTPFAK